MKETSVFNGFNMAEPVWPKEMQDAVNFNVGFTASFPAVKDQNYILRITGSTAYRIFLNGKFLFHGPARGPHCFFRVDELDLEGNLKSGKNLLAVEVASYNIPNYQYIKQPPFLQAEVLNGNEVLVATGKDFCAVIPEYKIREVERYSSQRTYVECVKLNPENTQWYKINSGATPSLDLENLSAKQYLDRIAPYPEFIKKSVVEHMFHGNISYDNSNINFKPLLEPKSGYGFNFKEIKGIPSAELKCMETESCENINQPIEYPLNIEKMGFNTLDFSVNSSGFIGLDIHCREKSVLFLTFDEILIDGDVNPFRNNSVNTVKLEIKPGEYQFETFEPYTFRYLKLIALEGNCEIRNIYIREYVNPEASKAVFNCSDPILNRVLEAARETFAQNAPDIFMDCPGRERAGWIGDTMFTARAGFNFTGNTSIEKVMFENYLLPEKFENLPDGMIPMCYPADSINGRYIPNFSLYFLLQLEEYYHRSGDDNLIEEIKPRVFGILGFFEKYENSDGLLEKLESWIFIEWSAAKDFVQDVSFLVNMVYAGTLEAVGRLYQRDELLSKANGIRAKIRELAMKNRFFSDNAVRNADGKLEITDNHTEICQYIAFDYGIANPDENPELTEILIKQFDSSSKENPDYPEIHKKNILFGTLFRQDFLSNLGRRKELLAELKDTFSSMAEITGTLWEMAESRASCNHGCIAHVAHVIYRDILGVQDINIKEKTISIHIDDLPLDFCEGKMPLGDDEIGFSWRREGETVHYKLNAPDGFEVNITHNEKIKIVQ